MGIPAGPKSVLISATGAEMPNLLTKRQYQTLLGDLSSDLGIDQAVILDGEGNLTVDGSEDHRVFSVAEGATPSGLPSKWPVAGQPSTRWCSHSVLDRRLLRRR